MSNFSNRPGMFQQAIRINAPIDFYLAGKMSHRICFNASACDAQFLALHEYGAGAAKRVQHALLVCHPESLKIRAYKMRGK